MPEEAQIDGRDGGTEHDRRHFLKMTGGAGVAVAGLTAFAASSGVGSPLSAASSESGIVEMTAVDLRGAIAARRVSCREVMAAYLARIERLNPTFHAIVSLRDPGLLLQQADAADIALRRDGPRGPLHGFPQAPKDAEDTADIVTTRGSQLTRNYQPKSDSLLVERARKAGAIMIGKTNMPEFGLGSHTYNSIFPTTVNAWNPALSAGGSSGGAGTAIAQRLLPLADGSDMMGSIRNPAGWANIVGLRTSFGRIPSVSGDTFFMQLPVQGPMARTVADAALLLSAQAGFDDRNALALQGDPRLFAGSLDRDFKGARVGFLGDLGGYLPMEDGVLDVCRKSLRHFEALGCIVEDVTPRFDLDSLWQAWVTLRSSALAAAMGGMLERQEVRDAIKPEVIWELEQGKTRSAAQVWAASAVRSAWYAELHRLYQSYDFLVLPTAQVFPFDANIHWPKSVGGRTMDTYHRWMEIAIYATLASVPTLAVPAGFDSRGRPMGIQIMARPQQDLTALQIGHAYEKASGFSKLRAAGA